MRIVQVTGGALALGALVLGMTACQGSAKPAQTPGAPGGTTTSPAAPSAAQGSPSPAGAPPVSGATSGAASAPGTAAGPTAVPATAPTSLVKAPRTGAPTMPTVSGVDPQEPVDPQRPEHTFPAGQ